MATNNAVNKSSKITTFTSNGSWTIEPRAVEVVIYAYGGGGGGGSGRSGATGAASGGCGGQGGRMVVNSYLASTVTGSPYTITIGSGGTGGISVSTALTDGNPGIAGGASSVGTLVIAGGGDGGLGGLSVSGAVVGSVYTIQGFSFISPGSNTSSNAFYAGDGSRGVASAIGANSGSASGVYCANTGGSGAPGYASGSARPGIGAGNITDGSGTVLVAGGLAGNNAGATAGNGNAPGAGLPFYVGGTGGGSGGNDGGAVTPIAGTGGNGGSPCGGGGGGSGTLSGQASGAGGNGAAGKIVIVEYF